MGTVTERASAALKLTAHPVVRGGGIATLGRCIGALWTAELLLRLGLVDYGVYSIAFAAASLVASLFDSPFYLRSARLPEKAFLADRALRVIVAVGLTLVGVIGLLLVHSYVLGFAAIFAGGEAGVGVLKARAHRGGSIVREQVIDLARQAAAISCGTVLLLVGRPSLVLVSIAYSFPYFVSVVAAIRVARPNAARFPNAREFATLSMTSLLGAGYMQLDVILIGLLLGPRTAGSYAIASLIAWSLCLPAQQWANARIPMMRANADLTRRLDVNEVALIGLALGGAAAFAGVVTAVVFPPGREAAIALLGLTPFIVLRSVNWQLSLRALFHRQDGTRLVATVIALVVDVAVILVLATPLRVLAASIAAVLADAALAVVFLSVASKPPAALFKA